jgi:hypothetical protein
MHAFLANQKEKQKNIRPSNIIIHFTFLTQNKDHLG